jgi:hypothetical protein
MVAPQFECHSHRNVPRPREAFRPQLESLDDRIVPATLRWTDALGNFTDPNSASYAQNWQVLVDPVNNIWAPAAQAPQYGDDVVFDGSMFGGPSPLQDCNGLHVLPGSGPNSFNSVQLINGYSGTVTLGDDASGGLTTSTLNLTSGAISQPDPGLTDLTVLSNLNWTGGTLNSSPNLANLIISGTNTTATFAPTNGGTVNLGDNISLQNSAVATMNAGTLNATNANEVIDLTQNCGMQVNPGANSSYTIATNVQSGVELDLDANSYLTVLTGTFRQKGYLYNGILHDTGYTGGIFTLMPGTSAVFSSPDGQPKTLVQQSAGITQLYGGSTLDVGTTNNVNFGHGTLTTLYGGGSSDATIKAATVKVYGGGDIFIDGGDPVHQFGTLTVDGNTDWISGTFHPFVQEAAGGATQSDIWNCTGTFSITGGFGGATFAPAALNESDNPIMPDSGLTWTMITAAQGITRNIVDPSFTTTGIWGIVKAPGNPCVEWDLKAL